MFWDSVVVYYSGGLVCSASGPHHGELAHCQRWSRTLTQDIRLFRRSHKAEPHYRYIVPLIVPVVAWFAIANWASWQFYLNAFRQERVGGNQVVVDVKR